MLQRFACRKIYHYTMSADVTKFHNTPCYLQLHHNYTISVVTSDVKQFDNTPFGMLLFLNDIPFWMLHNLGCSCFWMILFLDVIHHFRCYRFGVTVLLIISLSIKLTITII